MLLIQAEGGFDAPEAGKYLRFFDPDLHGGRGLITTTSDIGKARRFADAAEALLCWRQQSRRVPYRPDGKPNRPLTAFTVSFETV
jgi:hypothetical protein